MAKSKRAHGEGTYKKRKDGRWEAQYMVHTPRPVPGARAYTLVRRPRLPRS